MYHFITRLLLTTLTELSAIAAAAMTGLNRNPVNGYRTPAAIGMPTVLYTNAQKRFCFILRNV